MKLLLVVVVVVVCGCRAAIVPDGEPDLCAGLSNTHECSEANCMCRLQQQRGFTQEERDTFGFNSIEEGCFATQSCPELNGTALQEPVKCRLSASSTTTVFRFNDEHYDDSVSSNREGDGTVLTFPQGLAPGSEIAIKYNAVGEIDLVVSLGIGCDGFIYLLGEDQSSGEYICSEQDPLTNKCVGSCPTCVLCKTVNQDGFSIGRIYKATAWQKLSYFIKGEAALSGVVYKESLSRTNCLDDGAGNFYCSGIDGQVDVSIQCAPESKFSDLVGRSSNSGISITRQAFVFSSLLFTTIGYNF